MVTVRDAASALRRARPKSQSRARPEFSTRTFIYIFCGADLGFLEDKGKKDLRLSSLRGRYCVSGGIPGRGKYHEATQKESAFDGVPTKVNTYNV